MIWEKFQAVSGGVSLAPEHCADHNWQDWEIPREADAKWSAEAKQIHSKWWEARIARQKDIDASIAAKAESRILYDKPYIDRDRVRVAGPFTVENLSPHRTLAVDWDDELIDEQERAESRHKPSGREK